MTKLGSLFFYVFSFLIATIFMKISDKTNKKIDKKVYLVISLLIPILISALRWDVGTDFLTYVKLYKTYLRNNVIDLEIMFTIIVKIASFFNNVQFMFAIYSFLTVIFIYKALKYNKGKYPLVMTFFLYLFLYFTTSFNIIRQALAISIIFYSYRYLLEKNFKKFVFWVLVASLSHTTALLFLPFYFIVPNKIEKIKKIQISQFLSLLILFIIVLNFNTIMQYLTRISNFEKYSSYTGEMNGLNRMFILKIILLFVFIIFRKPLIKYDNKSNIYILLYIISIIFEFLGFKYVFAKRITMYFSIVEIYLLGCIPQMFTDKKMKMLSIFGIMSYAIFVFIITTFVLGQADIIPYQSILQNL